ncbi:MAG: ferritin family protein [Solirubrobacterales bacterium]
MYTNTFNGLEMLKIAITMEEEGFKFYTEGAKNTSGDVKEFLTAAAAQEWVHKEVFSKQYEGLLNEKGDTYEYIFDSEVSAYLKALIENKVFDNEEKNKNAFKDFKSAVEQSVKSEELTVSVYEKMYEGITNPEAKAIMEKIINEEKAHVTYFKSLL